MGARFYICWLGRWLSPDPINSENYNLQKGYGLEKNKERDFLELTASSYEYAYDNPINYTDETGEQPNNKKPINTPKSAPPIDPVLEGSPQYQKSKSENPKVKPASNKGNWSKDDKGNLIAGKGDSAGSLASNLGISQENAEKLLASQGYKFYEKEGVKYTQINEGSKVKITFSELEKIDPKVYDKKMNEFGYVKADIVQIDKITATEYSTDRTKHTDERGFEQVGKIRQEYVLKNSLNTHHKLNPAATIQYYPYSNVQRFHFEYIVPLGTGINLANDLNNKSSKSKTIMKGGKADNMGLLKELWKVIKRK